MLTKWKTLGSGSYGTVHLAAEDDSLFLSTSSTIAVKTAKLESSTSLQREAKILKEFKGDPYIIQCFGEDRSLEADGRYVYSLLMEYAARGDLNALILSYQDRMPESHAARYAYMLLQGLSHIHRKGFIHCDIKPANVLVFPSQRGLPHLKISDFGLSKHARENIHKFRGSPYYAAPESLQWGLQGTAADIWSLGCVVLEMMNGGRQLWKEENGFEADIPEYVSESGRDFLKKCFQCVDSRWSAEMLLKHPFITDNIRRMVPPPGFELKNVMRNNSSFGASPDQWSVTEGRFSCSSTTAKKCSAYQLFPESHQGCFSLFA